MKIKELASEEFDNLKFLAKRFQSDVEKTLSEIRKEKVRLYLPEKETYRLLKLRIWIDLYSVDLRYILTRLLPFWQQFVMKRTARIRSEGLGVRVGTLTGKKSEEMLRQLIAEDFPQGQNELLRQADRQESIIHRVLNQKSKDVQTTSDTSKTLFDFTNPEGYLQYYRRRIRKHSEIKEYVQDEMSKRPFRGNPFNG